MNNLQSREEYKSPLPLQEGQGEGENQRFTPSPPPSPNGGEGVNQRFPTEPVEPAFPGYGNGHCALQGSTLRLFHDLDRLFLSWAADCGAGEYRFPSTLPARELNKIGYFKSFPHHLTLPVSLDADHHNLTEFAAREPLDANGTLRLGKCTSVKDVLTPAACYHFYINFQNQVLNTPRYVTTRATCFRRETRYVPLRRQWSFSMREIVCIGTAAEVTQFLDARRKTLEEFFAAIGLPIEWQDATDPFFNPSGNPKYLAQKLDPVKLEMVFGGDVAIGSVNFHRNYFGEAFRIFRDGDESFSGCVAFGLERWIHAFLTHFGDDEARWPDVNNWRQ
jgi:seryl-tRNA synthetase